MAPCSPPERLYRPVFKPTGILQAIAALFVACIGIATPASAQNDSATAASWQPVPGSNDPEAQTWHSRTATPSATDNGQVVPFQYQYQQPRRSKTVSGVKQASFQSESNGAPPSRTRPQNEPAFADVWDDDEPAVPWNPPVDSGFPCQGCGGYGGEECGGCGDLEECPLGQYLAPFANRLWASGEYLLWWTRGDSLPPLVTTSPDGTARDVAGRLDQPGTTILLGGNGGVSSDVRSGGRVVLGYWLFPCQGLGFEGSYLGLGSKATQYAADSNSFSILARPFYNIQGDSQGQDAALIVYPGVADGSITVATTSEFQTAEALLRRHLVDQCDRHIDFLFGYRYGVLKDTLSIDESTTSLDSESLLPVGTTFRTLDQFDTQNQFQGGEVGIVFQQRYCRWSLDLLMKLALGSTHSQVAINGSTAITPRGGGTTAYNGGILALPTNIGTYEEKKFSLMPELGVTLGFDVTRHLRATLGYSFLYWSNVARPGDQIDTDLNATQFPPGTLEGAARPKFAFHTSDFWAQGLNVGLEYRF